MSNGILGIDNPLEKMSQSDDFLGTEESKKIREGLGFYMTPDMYLTEQEKADRPGGKYFSGPINFLRSLALMGPSKPRDFTQVTGQDTEDKFDDIFYEKYTTDFYQNVPTMGGVVARKELIPDYTVSPEKKELFEQRVAMTGSSPIGNALGILELSTVAQLIPLVTQGVRRGFGFLKNTLASKGRTPEQIKEVEDFFNATFPKEVKQKIINAKSQDEAIKIIMDRFQPAGGKATTNLPPNMKGYTFIEMPDEFYKFTGSREQYINAKPELRITQRKIYEKHLELEKKYGDLPIWQKLMENYKANPISVDGRSYNTNVLQKIKHIDKYLDTQKNKFSKSKPGLENVTMEDYVFPKDVNGNLLSPTNQTKFRNLVDDYQQYLSDRRRYENSYNKSKSKPQGSGYDTIARSEANQQLNWMLENARQNPNSVFKVVEVKGKTGKPVRVGVLDTDSGITYYRDGFLEGDKLVRQLGKLDPALHKSIINHPDFLETKKLFDARRTYSHTLPSDDIAKQFDNYEFPGRPEEFRLMDKLSEYVTILERGADPATYPGFGKASMLDIHHTKGVGVEATDPRYLQLVERNANQRETVSAAFYNALKMGDTTEAALKIAAKEVKRFPGLRLDLKLPDGSFVRVGQKLSPEAAIKKHRERMEKIINKYIKQDENFIDDFAEFVGLKRKGDMSNITESEMAMGMMGMGNAEGGTPVSRKDKFQEGTQDITSFDQFGPVPGTITAAVNSSVQSLQEQIKNMYKDKIDDSLSMPLSFAEIKAEEIQNELQTRLNPPRPVKFKFSELPKLITKNPIVRNALATAGNPSVPFFETVELLYNGLRTGTENDIQMEEFFPQTYAMHKAIRGEGTKETPKEQDFISMIDEINRAQEKGIANFGFNIADLALSIPDAVLSTEFTEEVKRQYAEMDIAQPETFLGNLGALIVEYGIPGSIAFKITNRFRKLISNKTKGAADRYLYTRKTYGLEGLPKLGVQISNVAKRVGSTSLNFGAADFVAGGPYNTLTEMFDDPLLSDKLVGKLEDVSQLSGKERVAANFRNRLRYGAEGAMIGGLFPLVGPALGVVGKNILLKPTLFTSKYLVAYPVGGLLKGASFLASKDPVVLPGIASGAGAFAKFLGQDVLARLAATAATGGKAFVPSLKGSYGQLPEFNKWRMFDVTSSDPLEAGLKSVDNFLKWFRDSGNQALYAFNLSGGAERFIKSKAREIEKYLDSIERKSYDLANGFLKRYNQNTTSPAGERHMLEQVYEYLRGDLKLSKIEPELQELAKALKDEFTNIKRTFVDQLPEGSGLRAFLESNLDKYMRASFSVFTNPRFAPTDQVMERATDFMVKIINANDDLIEAAVRGVPVTEQSQAIREFARKNVDNIVALGKRDGIDPIETLKKVNREILRGDDTTVIQTGEELPKVIRELLGETTDLRASVMTTAGSLVTQSTNLKSFKEFARHGLENGYLFTSRAEALAAGITDPLPIGSVPGLGGLQDLAFADKGGPIGLFASREMKNTIEGTGGMLDSLLQNSFYQSLIAYKAGVQTGKTVFSPATQTRNFGSAGFFPLNVGHIGGGASVTDAFKIVMDDIFGAGRTVDEVDLIKRITRKIDLGVLDENIVASELSAILQDIKGGKLKALGALSERVDSSKLFKTATRVYAGGDNVWKWYGHEFYMSQLKNAFKSFDDVRRYMKDFHNVEISNTNIFRGNTKTLEDGIEEAAAYLLRETYPTYSKVPEFVKAIRKLPIGNFVSFTSEILRTSFATSAIAMKHIASDNPVLREMGYRALSGQAITLGGVTAGVQGLAHAMTNVTPTQLDVYKEYFAPEYMKFSSLIPVTNVEDGVFEVFDMSRYHPYDIVTSSARELFKVADRQFHNKRIAELTETLRNIDPGSEESKNIRQQIANLSITSKMGQSLDTSKITTNTLRQYLSAVGPLYNSITGTFFGIPIGAEAFIEAARGRTFDGSTIWKDTMPETEIFDRAMGHFFKTIEPGLFSSGRKLFRALRGDVSGVGQPVEINTEVFKLMGGSNVKVDILGSLDFKVGDFIGSFRDPKMGRRFYATDNYQSRGPDQLVNEYRKQNEDAFRAQYEFYKAAMAAIDSGLISRMDVIRALQKRIAPGSKTIPDKINYLMSGRYTPLSYGPEGLKGRREKIIRNNADLDQVKYNFQYFLPFGALEAEKNKWKGLKFEDFEKKAEPQRQSKSLLKPPVEQTATATEPVTPPLPEAGQPTVAPTPVAGLNPLTGLTTTETALLSPGEQAIRQRQRTTGIA